MYPVKSISILISPPTRPQTIPKGRPKLSPIPDSIPGTIARTNTPFIPVLIRVSDSRSLSGSFRKTAITHNTIIKVIIISLGIPRVDIIFLVDSSILTYLLSMNFMIVTRHH